VIRTGPMTGYPVMRLNRAVRAAQHWCYRPTRPGPAPRPSWRRGVGVDGRLPTQRSPRGQAARPVPGFPRSGTGYRTWPTREPSRAPSATETRHCHYSLDRAALRQQSYALLAGSLPRPGPGTDPEHYEPGLVREHRLSRRRESPVSARGRWSPRLWSGGPVLGGFGLRRTGGAPAAFQSLNPPLPVPRAAGAARWDGEAGPVAGPSDVAFGDAGTCADRHVFSCVQLSTR